MVTARTGRQHSPSLPCVACFHVVFSGQQGLACLLAKFVRMMYARHGRERKRSVLRHRRQLRGASKLALDYSYGGHLSASFNHALSPNIDPAPAAVYRLCETISRTLPSVSDVVQSLSQPAYGTRLPFRRTNRPLCKQSRHVNPFFLHTDAGFNEQTLISSQSCRRSLF